MSRTYEVPEYLELALSYRDPDEWLIADEIFVPQYKETKQGKYRVDDSLMWFQRYDFRVGKEGYPTDVDVKDAFIEWNTERLGKSYPISFDQMKDYKARGFASAEQYRQFAWEYLVHIAKIQKEIAAITEIETSGNYDAANLHTVTAGDFAGSTVWSDSVHATPISDVEFLKMENPVANTIVMSALTMYDLMKCGQILDFGSVTASDRNQMSPRITKEYLQNCFGLTVLVSKAQAITAATADRPTASQAKGPLWGNYVWVGLVNKQSQGPRAAQPTWGHEYVYSPVEGQRGWDMTETRDDRAKVLHLDLNYWNEYQVYAKSYGQKLAGVN